MIQQHQVDKDVVPRVVANVVREQARVLVVVRVFLLVSAKEGGRNVLTLRYLNKLLLTSVPGSDHHTRRPFACPRDQTLVVRQPVPCPGSTIKSPDTKQIDVPNAKVKARFLTTAAAQSG